MGNGGKKRSFTSRTGVKQGCPISPLIYCIVFDLLVCKVLKGRGVTASAAYADDLAISLERAERVENLEVFFDMYCDATGAEVNYEKCFLLTTDTKYEPKGRWAEMKLNNYRSPRPSWSPSVT